MPKGVPLSEREREDIRRRIFETATRLFLRQGFHQTSVRQIAKATGMGKSTLYDYFTSKEEILLYFVEQEMKVINQTAAEIAAQALNAPEKLQWLLRAQFVYLDANREMAALLTREVSKLDEAATRQFAKRRQEYRHILQTIIEQGISEGVFRAVDPALAALALLSMLTMPFYDWLRRREEDSIETAIDALMDLFFSGLQVR